MSTSAFVLVDAVLPIGNHTISDLPVDVDDVARDAEANGEFDPGGFGEVYE